MGNCNGYANPGFASPVRGFRGRSGFQGAGMGRGRRHRFYARDVSGRVPPTPEQETADLKAQAEWLKKQLDAIQKRIEELTE
jgi:hypothetical protein